MTQPSDLAESKISFMNEIPFFVFFLRQKRKQYFVSSLELILGVWWDCEWVNALVTFGRNPNKKTCPLTGVDLIHPNNMISLKSFIFPIKESEWKDDAYWWKKDFCLDIWHYSKIFTVFFFFHGKFIEVADHWNLFSGQVKIFASSFSLLFKQI